MLKAEIAIECGNSRRAEAVAKAVSPDNSKVPTGLLITATWKGTKVLAKIEHEGKLATFIATIDDLFCCISTAEKILRAADKTVQ